MKFRSNRKSYEKRRRLPQGEKTRNPKVLVGSLAAIVISLVVLAIVIVIGIVGFSSEDSKVMTSDKVETDAPFHAWFMVDSNEVNRETDISEMSGNYIVKDDVSYIPLDGIVTALSGTLKYNEDTGVCKIRNIGKWVNLTVDSDVMRISLFNKKTLAAKVYMEDDVIYVPVASFFNLLGYDYEYTASSGRLDVFPVSEENEAPTASFTTDKDTYEVGEKIVYTTENNSPEGYEIVDEKWENYDDWYFESGEVNVSYAVKDYKGNWSESYAKTLTIEGEYKATESIPVLSYFSLAENDSDVYKTVTEQITTVKTTSSTGKVLSTKTTTKTVNYSDYSEKTSTKTTKDSSGNTVKTTIKYTQEKVKGEYYDNPYIIKLSQFEKEMAYLDDNGYTTLTVSEYLDYRDSGVMPPEKSVMILFVNGYETSYTLAYPILQEYGMKASIAPEVKTVLDRSALVKAVAAEEEGAQDELDAFDENNRFPIVTFDQLSEMVNSGTFEVGCISYDSNDWGNTTSKLAEPIYLNDEERSETAEEYEARVKEDVTVAIATLCDNLGEENTPFFIYPYGTTNEVLTAAVENAGFSCAFIKDDGYIYADTGLFALHRMNITQDVSNWDFSNKILK
jgi:biofilm PGA synthesis lipoprotein PgaB